MSVAILKSWIFWLLGRLGITANPSRGSFGSTSIPDIYEFYNHLIPVDFGHRLIRVGGDGDGGYVIPDDLNGVDRCFSPGCNMLASFESDLYLNYAIPSSVCDLEENLIQENTEGIDYLPKLVGPVSDETFISIEEWTSASKTQVGSDLLLQMDIEGAEYEVLRYMNNDVLKRFRILVIEFHNFELLKYSYFYRQRFLPIFQRLAREFDIVNVNANNAIGYWYLGPHRFPPILEITYHRRDRRKTMEPKRWSTNLNQLNVANRPKVEIPWSHRANLFDQSLQG